MQQWAWTSHAHFFSQLCMKISVVLVVSPIVRGTGRTAGGRRFHLRSELRAGSAECPGLEECSGRGSCDQSGMCWCGTGYGGDDCSGIVAEWYEIKEVNDPSQKDMIGIYELHPMFLQEAPGDPRNIKFLNYDPVAKGWAISKLNSSCTDDICFFAYGPDHEVPPPNGYVYGGNPDKHVYYKQLVYDDHDLFPGRRAGYHMVVAYTPDPNAVSVSEVFNQFTGRYIIQPRYVHRSGKFAIMPVSLFAPGKTWVIAGYDGVGSDRRWRVVAQTKDSSNNRNAVPVGPWQPDALGLQCHPTCPDHLSQDACWDLSDHCNDDTPDKGWIRACCRQTCGACTTIPPTQCRLPKTGMFQLRNSTSA